LRKQFEVKERSQCDFSVQEQKSGIIKYSENKFEINFPYIKNIHRYLIYF